MPVSNRHKCIFVHIPKCAGSAIENALSIKRRNAKQLHGPDGNGDFLQHLTIHEISEMITAESKDYFTFAIVRNPYSKMVSDFAWCKRWFKHAWLCPGDTKVGFTTFDSYIQFIEKVGVHAWSHFRPQHEFVCNKDGSSCVDFIGKIENIQRDFDYVKQRIVNAENIELKKTNKSQHKPWPSYYNAYTINAVNTLYGKDFELFHYEQMKA